MRTGDPRRAILHAGLALAIAEFAPLAGAAELPGNEVRIEVRADQVLHPVSRYLTGACLEDVNHEIYGGIYSQMVFGESFQEPPITPIKGLRAQGGDGQVRGGELPFSGADPAFRVSGMWGPVRTGTAVGALALEADRPFVGRQAQRLTFVLGAGQIGVENQGLNRWGMCFLKGEVYEGLLWVRAEAPVDLCVALESKDGAQALAEERLAVKPGGWERLSFRLKPRQSANPGRLALTLRNPGSVLLGYASLQPGGWGRFKGLPVRRDVAQGLIDQGITVLRYGGSMVNHPEYRWKQMIGPRDRRPPCHGTWYPYASNGWGIPDFMNFCEAAGFQYIPAFNLGETPQDMADFIRYAKQPADGDWGRRRGADGHPGPYRLRFIELGNEETVDGKYWEKFRPMAEAIWAEDAGIVPVVGDFFYSRVIEDPYHFGGGAVQSLAVHRKILDLAREHGCEVAFDIHIGTEQPPQPGALAGERSFIDQLAKLSPGAKFSVVIFEFNAGNHGLKRALANALAINRVERDGRIPIATSANGLQPDGQNDNGWNQGLLFLNPARVWLQPPGFVTQMFSRNYQPLLVSCQAAAPPDTLDVNAKRSEDGRTLVLQAVNPTDQALEARIHLTGFAPRKPAAQVTELSGPLEAVNTAAQTNAIVPVSRAWRHRLNHGETRYTFPPYSITVLRLF